LINIGSTTAFLAILSLATLALYISYLIPITFVLIRKLEGRPPNYGPFKLGRWGIPINIFSIAWGIFTIIWLPFPVSLPVTKDTMNYAAPVWGAGLAIALVDWFISGHKRFRIPAGVDTDWLATQKPKVSKLV
jgi:choline transport protein